MKILNIIFIIFSILPVACKKDKKTEVFQNYLSRKFKLNIPEQECIFLIIPNNQCGNCFNTYPHASILNQKNTYIITSLNPMFFSKYSKVLFDSTNELQKLDFLNFSNTLIMTRNRSINSLENNIDLFSD